jgi:hypothetical protein
MSYSMWNYFLRNYFRGHLSYDHSHARCVLASVAIQLNHPDLEGYVYFIENSWESYNSNKINLETSSEFLKFCSDDIAKRAPRYYYYPIKLSEKLLNAK